MQPLAVPFITLLRQAESFSKRKLPDTKTVSGSVLLHYSRREDQYSFAGSILPTKTGLTLKVKENSFSSIRRSFAS